MSAKPSSSVSTPETQPEKPLVLFDLDDMPGTSAPTGAMGHDAAVAAGEHYDPAYDPAETNRPTPEETIAAVEGSAKAWQALENSGNPDIEEVSPEAPVAKAKPSKVAFGSRVKSEMYDVFGEYDLEDLTNREKSWMTATNLTAAIFDPPEDADLVVKQNGSRIALNAYEYGLLARHPQAFARQIGAKVLGANDIDEERLSASERGTQHGLAAKIDAMTDHVEQMDVRRGMIKKLAKEAKAPGYAHYTEAEMNEWLSAAWVEFKGMLDVRHVQKGWSDETRKRAEAALIHHLTQGSQREKVGHWRSMLTLAENSLRARTVIFRDRIKQAQKLVAA